MPLLTILLMLAYPLLMHLSIHNGAPDVAVYVLAFYCVLPLLIPGFRRRLSGLKILILCLLGMSIVLFGSEYPEKIIVIPPLLIFAGMAYVFASSLQPGSVPLVTRFALIIRGELPDYVTVYTRKATMAWVLFFAMMLLINTVLAIWAPLETWSYFSNFIAWILTGAMFLGEYLVRRYSMPDHVDYSFIEFLRNLARVDYRHVFK